jgi:hypothetical protein
MSDNSATSSMMPLNTEMRNNLINEPTSVNSTMSDTATMPNTTMNGGNLLARLLL